MGNTMLVMTICVIRQTDGKLGKMLPLIVYAVLTITVGLVSLRLPETNKRKLTETVEEAG